MHFSHCTDFWKFIYFTR